MTLRRTPLSLVIFALAIIIATSATIQPVKALGVIYINPSNQGPASGSSITYSVKVASMDPFTGWDIAVQTDPTVVNPQSITAKGINLLQLNYTVQASELINCVNNVGTNCEAGVDGPGVAHSFLNIAGLPPMSTPTSGLLFNITYSVVKPSSSSVLHIYNEQIFNGSPNPVAHTSTDGTYNNPQIFSIIPSPQSLTIYQSGSAPSTLSLTSINGFAGTVTLSVTVSNSSLANRPTASLSVASVPLTSGGMNTTTVTVSVSASTHTGPYWVVVNATTVPTKTNLVPFSVFTMIPVFVPDFSVSAIPASVFVVPPGTIGTSTINMTSLNGFQDTVILAQAVTGGPVGACPGANCPSASFSLTSLTLSSGSSATSTLTVSTTSSTPLGAYVLTVTASANKVTAPHSLMIPVSVKVQPSILITIKNSSGVVVTLMPVGTTVYDTATLAGATSDAGGTVNYTIFTNNACTGSGTSLSTVTVVDGIVPDSAPATPLPAGSFSFNASYSGDAFNNAAISPCDVLTVNKLSPTLASKLEDSTGATVSFITVGSAIRDRVTLSNSFQASGLVAYTPFDNGACMGLGMTVSTVTVANGVVPDFTSQLFNTPGFFSINATYSGDINNNPAQSKCEPLTVKAVPTLATIIKSSTGANVNTVLAGSSVHDTALLSGGVGNLNGTVIYLLFPSIDCATGGTIISTVTVTNGFVPDSTAQTFSITGSFSWVAFYSGDTSNGEAASLCEPLMVTSPNIRIDSLTVTPNPSALAIGQLITFKVVIENNGTADAAFQIMIKWGSTVVATQNASLSPGRNQTFTLTWDTSKSLAGTNNISVIVTKVQGETITADHVLTGSSLTLAPPLPVTLLLPVGLPIATVTTMVILYLLLRRRKTRMGDLASSRSNGSEKIAS